MDLTIILRTCGNSGVIANNAMRVCGNDRLSLILKCASSLVTSINNITSDLNLKFYVLDDHSERSFLDKLEQILIKSRIGYELVHTPDRDEKVFKETYNWSAYEQFRYGRDANDLVYMVEDDYLHCPEAIQDMIDSWFSFKNLTDLNSVAIYPYDSTHNYKNLSEPARLFYFKERLWRTTGKTANTIFMHSDDIRKYWPLFDRLATYYGDGTSEDGTINRIWNNGVVQGGPVTLFSPIPSVAVHVSFDEPIKFKTELNDWRQLYDSIEVNTGWIKAKKENSIKHFCDNIHGWFDFHDFYSTMVNEAKDGYHFVEVGSWKGKSTAYMAVEIANSGKKIKFDCVDTWEGSVEHQEDQRSEDKDVIEHKLYDVFIENMKPVEGYYNPMRMTSLEAAGLYEDESLDFVFIDASHEYEDVKADILAWYPKVKKGGTLAGHDYPWESVAKAVNEVLADKDVRTNNVCWGMIKK